MGQRVSRLGLLLAAALVPACGDGGTTILQVVNPTGSLSLDVSGGGGFRSGTSGVAVGGMAGTVEVNSQGNLHVGVSTAPLPPTVPAAPTTGTVLTSFPNVISYTQDSGNILISGDLTTPNAPALAGFTITASEGDIVISGTLQAGENSPSGRTRILTLSAPKKLFQNRSSY